MKAKPRAAQVKLAVVLSDLHVGSTVGLWPEGFVANEGFPIGQNKFQGWLWECWQDCQKWIAETVGGDPYHLIFNGDMVEGIHHRTLQVMSADVGDQTDAVLMCVGDLVERASKTWMVKGTECHTRNDEVRLGRHLNCVRDPSTGQRAFDRLETDIHGCRIAASHHVPSTIRPYLEASQFSLSLGTEIIEAVRANKKPPRVVIRAHRHKFGVFTDGHGMMVVNGAWQGLTRHGHKVVPAGVPSPTCTILDWRDKKRGELPLPHWRRWVP